MKYLTRELNLYSWQDLAGVQVHSHSGKAQCKVSGVYNVVLCLCVLQEKD